MSLKYKNLLRTSGVGVEEDLIIQFGQQWMKSTTNALQVGRSAIYLFYVIKRPLNVCLNMFQDKTEEDDPSQVPFAIVQ